MVMTSSPYMVVTWAVAGLRTWEIRFGGRPKAMSSCPDSTSASAEFGSGFVWNSIDGTLGFGPQ